jgi:hypothetical protein
MVDGIVKKKAFLLLCLNLISVAILILSLENSNTISNDSNFNDLSLNQSYFPSTNNYKTIPNPEKFNINKNVQSFDNESEKDLFNYPFTFTNSTRSFSFNVNTTKQNQIIYFQLDNLDLKGEILVNLYGLNSINHTEDILLIGNNFKTSNFIYGEITLKIASSWQLIINSTYDFLNENISRTFSSELTIFFPKSGYSFNSPVNIFDNQTRILYNITFPYETIYFKILLEQNRRVDFTIKEVTESILNNTVIRFYQWDPLLSSESLLSDEPKNTEPGTYSYSWVSKLSNEGDTLWIEIKVAAGFTGNVELLFNFQTEGYSFNSAIMLDLNSTLIVNQKYRDRYPQSTFFKFKINESDLMVNIFAKSDNPVVLANSKLLIYYEREENFLFVLSEGSALSDNLGSINGSFFPQKAGTYYVEYIPTLLPTTGFWSLKVSYSRLPSFSWPFEFILINIFYLLVIPIILFYFRLKSLHEQIYEWEINQNSTDIFKVLSKNPRLSPKMEVPYQKVLLIRKNPLIRDIIIDIVPVQTIDSDRDEKSTLQTSIALRYKKIIDNLLSFLIIVLLMGFWFINTTLFLTLGDTILPYRTASLSSINELIYYLIIPSILVLQIFYYYNESYVKNIINEIEYSINEIIPIKNLNYGKSTVIDNENLIKNLAYIRVLWNQAVKGFNEKNYSLFIIRADNSVKKLLETRFQQLIGSIDEKLEFNEIIEAVRNQGFDIPSLKKIEYFRKIRNKIVHSSHLLDEKTAIETFTYYSKFLGRLGLRT